MSEPQTQGLEKEAVEGVEETKTNLGFPSELAPSGVKTGSEPRQREEVKVVESVPKLTKEQEMLWSKSLFYAEEGGSGGRG